MPAVQETIEQVTKMKVRSQANEAMTKYLRVAEAQDVADVVPSKELSTSNGHG